MSTPVTTTSTNIPAPAPAPSNGSGPSQTPAGNVAASQSQKQVESVIPTVGTLQQAAKLAIQQDKRIMLDYYNDSLNEKAFIGEDQGTKERILIKTRKDFTSLIQRVYKVGDDFLIMTENSIYITSANIMKRRVNLASLDYDYNDDE